MTEKLKTRSEVWEELEKAVDLINNGYAGVDSLQIKKDKLLDRFWVSTSNGVVVGNARKYTPEPDTKEQALDKAQSLQREKEADENVAWCSCIRPGDESSCYTVEWYNCEKSMIEKEHFPFVSPAPKSEYITDEPPPEGTQVVSDSGKVFSSLGYFINGSNKILEVVDENGHGWIIKTYRSITTPHRSADWDD